jgi:molecular chaperone HscB
MPGDFLIQQMEWRELIEDALQAHDIAALETLEARLRRESGSMEASLAGMLDDEQSYAAAAGEVRKLRFLEKLAEEISSAYDEIDT